MSDEIEFDKIFEKMQINKQCFFPKYRNNSEVSQMKLYFVFSTILHWKYNTKKRTL